MTRAKFSIDKASGTIVFICVGHSGAANKGSDIICASASILTYTLAQTVHSLYEGRFLRKRPKIKLEDGVAKIVSKPKETRFSEIYNAFCVIATGFSLLEAAYPEYVSLDTTDFEAKEL